MLKKNHKGQIFGLFLVFAFIAGMMYAFTVIIDKKDSFSRMPIGDSQFRLIEMIVSGEKITSFVDSSAKQATFQSVYDFAAAGGIIETTGCGAFNGLSLWTSDGKECFPGKKELVLGFGFLMGKKLDSFFKTYSSLQEYKLLLR